jgi:hypothetical protein
VAQTLLVGFKISGVVEIDQVAARLTAVYSVRQEEPNISPLGSAIENLRVFGHRIELIPLTSTYHELDTMQKVREHYKTDAQFRHEFELGTFVSQKPELPKKTHKFFPWLNHRDNGQLPEYRGHTIVPLFRIIDPMVPGIQVYSNVIEIRDFGRLVVGELFISGGERRLVMIQADLGSPDDGYIAACAATAGCELKSGGLGFVRETRRYASGGAPDTVREMPPGAPLDAVHFSIAAPQTIAANAGFELTFFAHLREQREEALTRAKEVVGDREPLFRSEGPFQVARGAELKIRVSIPRLKIKSNQKTLVWVGEIGVASFTLFAPRDAHLGQHAGKASVRVNGFEIAAVDFLMTVGPDARTIEHAPLKPTMHRNAFASYASEDRDEVLACVQGMLKAARHLEVFVDVVNLRSGQLWEPELLRRISQSDIFYLFWCRHAMTSKWVEKEWQQALTKGLDFIDPVPLEGPEIAPPPVALASKHFNEPLLAYRSKGHHSGSTVA